MDRGLTAAPPLFFRNLNGLQGGESFRGVYTDVAHSKDHSFFLLRPKNHCATFFLTMCTAIILLWDCQILAQKACRVIFCKVTISTIFLHRNF